MLLLVGPFRGSLIDLFLRAAHDLRGLFSDCLSLFCVRNLCESDTSDFVYWLKIKLLLGFVSQNRASALAKVVRAPNSAA